MRQLFLVIVLLLGKTIFAQQVFNPAGIDIVRDSFGVPHIFAPTDAGVAYGLAWAHAEDDFKTIQQGFLAGKKMLGRYSGKDGAAIDYVVHLIQAEELVNAQYDTAISVSYKKVLEGYCAGINAYAAKHPKEVLVKQLFPVTPQAMLTYSVLQLFVSCGGDLALQKIVAGKMPALTFLQPGGSNAYAFNSNKTTDGAVYLNINSHQPLDGPVSWYEAHLHSDEGWNIIGALFPGAPSILVGCNENLGWGHTVNHPDKLDVFQLQTNPQNKLQYWFNDGWETLTEKTVKLKVKVAGVVITVKRKIYESKYGPTYIAGNGTFSIRTGALFTIKGLEQWYYMNKARNFTEFYKALQMQGIPGYNVVYADKYDTIYYLSNGLMPYRNAKYLWNSTVRGNTTETLWKTFHPVEELPQVLNPPAGYLFNSNHTPYNATAPVNNIKAGNYDATMGYETHDNNRSIRFMQLLEGKEKISYEDFKRIKYDLQLPQQLAYTINSDSLFLLNATAYTDIAEEINLLTNWNRTATIDNTAATLFAVIYYYVVNQSKTEWAGIRVLNKEQAVTCIRYAKNYLLQYFGTAKVPLGQYQLLVRGNKTIGLPGLPDVIASMESEPYKDGRVRGRQGESYIELVRFTKDGPQIESINCYGASNNPASKHYSDQMELFVEQKTKPMSLDKATVYKMAASIYHPQ